VIVNLSYDAMLYENRDRENPASGASAYFVIYKINIKRQYNSSKND
jgi:hypothetical protein